MRKSRVIIAGIAVAAAAAAGSAFTASNTFAAGIDQSNVGYGSYSVTGATVTKVVYNQDATDAGTLDSIEFTHDATTTTLDTANTNAVLALSSGSTPTANGANTCVIGGVSASKQLITCTFGTTKPNIGDFTTVALSVMPK